MKSLSLSRPLVIMVIGLPGSGKSFFARQFSDMFGAPLVSVDFIRNTISPDSQYSTLEDSVVASVATSQILELLKTSKTFVVDGGVNNRASRLTIARDAKKHEYGLLTIWVQTDEPTSLARSTRRSNKRVADELNTSLSPRQFERYQKQFSIPTPSENIVVISGKHTFTTQARIVLKALVAPRETPVQDRATPTRPQTKPEQPHDIQPRRHNVIIN